MIERHKEGPKSRNTQFPREVEISTSQNQIATGQDDSMNLDTAIFADLDFTNPGNDFLDWNSKGLELDELFLPQQTHELSPSPSIHHYTLKTNHTKSSQP